MKHRMRGLVEEKLAEVEARLAELRALRSDLRSASELLATAPLDGPCDESCGCVATSDARTTIVPLTGKRKKAAR